MDGQQQEVHLHQRRIFRVRRDILNEYSDTELMKRYRLDCGGIIFVADLVKDVLQAPTMRNKALTPEEKVMITLHYLATGKMQLCNGDDFGVSQPTISRVITQTLDALTAPNVFRQFINFPLDQHVLQRKKLEFMEISGFPNVVGAIDGTHVKIIAPKIEEASYVNRKHYHSINVQVVFDAKYKILDIVAKWPGSVHDARILDESGLKLLFENNHIPAGCLLLGDSGYPSKRWLLTPYLRPQPGPETAYNRAHKATRAVVERGIGQLKRRFHVLHGEVRVDPTKTCKIIYACAMLHNLCKDRSIQLPGRNDVNEDSDDDEDENGDEYDNFQAPAGRRAPGLIFRDHFVNTFFNDE